MILGVSYDALATESELRSYANNRGLSFPLALYDRSVVRDAFRVTSQSSAVGIDANGAIQLRKGFGGMNTSQWQEWVDTLTGS